MHTGTPNYIHSADAVVVPLHTVVCLHLLVPDATTPESVFPQGEPGSIRENKQKVCIPHRWSWDRS